MPLPSNSTAAVMRSLTPLSPSFMMYSLLILAGMVKLMNALSFSADQYKYDLTPISREYPEHNYTVYSAVYGNLVSGACGAHGFRQHEYNDDSTVVSVPGATIRKEGFDTNTTTDQCLKGIVYAAANIPFNNSISESDPNAFRNKILGIALGLLLLLAGISGFIYLGCRKFRKTRVIVRMDEEAVPVNEVVDAVPQVEVGNAAAQPVAANPPQGIINADAEIAAAQQVPPEVAGNVDVAAAVVQDLMLREVNAEVVKMPMKP